MKPAPFIYQAPETIEEAVGLLVEYGEPAKILAGGQSLVPMQNLRLARPEVVIDINRIRSHDYVEVDDATLRVGALARHATVETAVQVPGPLRGLLTEVGRRVGHLPIRLRGTFCGSLAHADPAAEWCALLTALDGVVIAQGPHGVREIPADDFFRTAFTTFLAPDEMIVEAQLPILAADWQYGTSFLSRRAGDFSIVLVIAMLRVLDGRITAARIALGGVADRPIRATTAEEALIGREPQLSLVKEAARAAAASVEPMDDLQGSSEYRRHLVEVLVGRALATANGSGVNR